MARKKSYVLCKGDCDKPDRIPHKLVELDVSQEVFNSVLEGN